MRTNPDSTPAKTTGPIPGNGTSPPPIWVELVYAMSLDGKISTADRAGPAFTGPEDRDHLARLRAAADAVVLGAGTVAADDPPFRLPESLRAERRRAGKAETPIRVVLSGRGTVSETARLFANHDSPAIVWTTDAIPPERYRALSAVAEVWRCGVNGTVNLEEALDRLATRYGVRRLLVEGGGQVNAAFLAADRVDALHVTVAPVLIGGERVPTPIDGEGLPLKALRRFRLVGLRLVGEELFLHYRRAAAVAG